MKIESNTRCDECETITTVVRVGEEPYYESSTARLCHGCAKEAYDLIEKHRQVEREELYALVAKARLLPAMTAQESAEQAANFAFGNLAMMKKYDHATKEQLDELKKMCRRAAGLK